MTRRYREGDDWKSSSSFSRDELAVVRALVDLAYTWICNHLASGEEESEA